MATASWSPGDGRYTLYASSQGSHTLRKVLCEYVFKIPEQQMRVVTGDVGGGFGMKIFMYPEYVLSLFAARKLNRPVKWTSDRSEAFLSDDHGRDNVSHADLALDEDGKFLAMRVSTVANLGAYLSQLRPLHPDRCRHRDAGRRLYDSGDPYPGQGRLHQHQPGRRLSRSRTAGSGLPSGTPCRCGGARAEHAPAELRRRNFIPPEAMPFKTSLGLIYDTGEFARNMDDALVLPDWDSFEQRREEAHAKGKLRGIGMSTYIEACSGGGAGTGDAIQMDGAGKVTVLIGSQSNGQGHETAYTQIVSARLGIPVENDRSRPGRQRRGSASAPAPAARADPGRRRRAVRHGGAGDRARREPRRPQLLEAASVDIEFDDGTFTIVGTDRRLTIRGRRQGQRAGQAAAGCRLLDEEAPT